MNAEWFVAPQYWLARQALQVGIAVVYLIAFIGAARQFRALIGERGMLPVPDFVARVPFRTKPSIFHIHYSDRFFAPGPVRCDTINVAELLVLRGKFASPL